MLLRRTYAAAARSIMASALCARALFESAAQAIAEIRMIFFICAVHWQALCRSCLRNWYGTSDSGRHSAQLSDELRELIGVERLRAIRQRTIRLRMDFDHNSIRTGRNGRPRHGNDLVAQTRSMTRIGDDRQM